MSLFSRKSSGDGPTEAQVLDSMRHIIDPDLGKDIVSLGFIKALKIDGGDVSFTVELTTPACPVKEQFRTDCEKAVKKLPGVKSVHVEMSAMERQKRPGSDINTLTRVDSVIAVSSCKGGVGKSTIAAQLARQLQREGLRVGLLDTDIYGPSIPTLFNLHRPQLMMRENMLIPAVADGLKLMSLGFVMGDSPAVMRGPMVSGYVQQILHQTDWGDLDYLIVDMPPGTGDIQLTLVQQAALDGAIIVTTPHSLSLVDVSRGILMFEKVNVPVLGIVENMSYFLCPKCEDKHYIFGRPGKALKDRFGLNTLAEFPIVDGISSLEGRNAGANLAPVRELADNLHRAVGKSRVAKSALPIVTAKPGVIHVKWPDGTQSSLPARDVRTSCQCAQCVHEFTGEQILDPSRISPDIQAKAIEPLGNYAVSIVWNDGHSSGIFTWDHLKEVAGAVAAV
ncbi:MAG: P-loop NTPase [Candidatus Hydrogenedentota bacterium]